MVSSNVRLYLENDFVSKENVDAAIAQYIEELDDDGSKRLLVSDSNANLTLFEFDESKGSFNFDIELKDGSTVYVEAPINDDVLADIMQYAVKRLNKLKTVLEGLK